MYKSFFSKINQDSLEKWLIVKLGQDIYKMNPECLVVLESKEVLKPTNQTPPHPPTYNPHKAPYNNSFTMMVVYQRDTGVT